jgi:hypothetical protein
LLHGWPGLRFSAWSGPTDPPLNQGGRADLEMDHVSAGRYMGMGTRQHVHRNKGRDLAVRHELQPVATN